MTLIIFPLNSEMILREFNVPPLKFGDKGILSQTQQFWHTTPHARFKMCASTSSFFIELPDTYFSADHINDIRFNSYKHVYKIFCWFLETCLKIVILFSVSGLGSPTLRSHPLLNWKLWSATLHRQWAMRVGSLEMNFVFPQGQSFRQLFNL